jgi:hypothetical protein
MVRFRNPPSWWEWELEFSVHVEQRMLERGITEVELRAMLESASELNPSHVEGRFVAETRHGGEGWAVVLEPDVERRCIAVVTVYNREEP